MKQSFIFHELHLNEISQFSVCSFSFFFNSLVYYIYALHFLPLSKCDFHYYFITMHMLHLLTKSDYDLLSMCLLVP